MLYYKHMMFNSDYVPFVIYRVFILKLIKYMQKRGSLKAFLVFCEVCPNFVTTECYPKFRDSLCNSELTEPLYIDLFQKHRDKWEKYIVPQLH